MSLFSKRLSFDQKMEMAQLLVNTHVPDDLEGDSAPQVDGSTELQDAIEESSWLSFGLVQLSPQ